MKKRKTIPFHIIFDPNYAYTTFEVAKMLGMHVITARKFLRRAYYAGILDMRKKGRFKLYALSERGRTLREEALKAQTEPTGGVVVEYADDEHVARVGTKDRSAI